MLESENYREGYLNGAYDGLYGFDPVNTRHSGVEDAGYSYGYNDGHLEVQVLDRLYRETKREGFDPHDDFPFDKPPDEHMLRNPEPVGSWIWQTNVLKKIYQKIISFLIW